MESAPYDQKSCAINHLADVPNYTSIPSGLTIFRTNLLTGRNAVGA
jgi:hypothetical protein